MTETKATILIVEDEPFILEAASEKLEREGYAVVTAKEGASGLDEALKSKPDLILLDILMPNVDGIQMLRQLRQDDWGKTAKVIIFTNLVHKEKEAEARELGVDDYLIKANWTLRELVEKVDRVLT